MLPGGGAVTVEDIKVLAGQELAAVHPGLDGAQPAQNANLLHIADQRDNVQPLQLRVDSVKSSHEVLQEELKGLRQTQHGVARDDEGRHLLPAVLDQFALVRRGIGRRYGRGRIVRPRGTVMVSHCHQIKGGCMMLKILQ